MKREKAIWLGIAIAVLFVAMVNISAKIFNTMDAWLGIGCGVVSVAVTYILARGLISKITKK